MQLLQRQIQINWPVEPLFNYVSDIANNYAWQQCVTDTSWLCAEKNTSGARFKEVYTQGKDKAVSFCEISEFIRYKKRTVFLINKSLCLKYIVEFEPKQDSTLLHVTLQARVRGQVENAFDDSVVAYLEQKVKDLTRLKEVLECEE